MEMTTTPGRGRFVAGEVQLRMINAGVKPCHQTERTSSATPKVPARILQFAYERVSEARTILVPFSSDGARFALWCQDRGLLALENLGFDGPLVGLTLS
jgi:hypothetical protein